MRKWMQREYRNKDSSYRIVEPIESGMYYVTDGYYVQLAHFIKDNPLGTQWGIYGHDKAGVVGKCYSVDDWNFEIKAYFKPDWPKIPARFQE